MRWDACTSRVKWFLLISTQFFSREKIGITHRLLYYLNQLNDVAKNKKIHSSKNSSITVSENHRNPYIFIPP